MIKVRLKVFKILAQSHRLVYGKARLHPAFFSHLPCITSMEPGTVLRYVTRKSWGTGVLRPGYSPWLRATRSEPSHQNLHSWADFLYP